MEHKAYMELQELIMGKLDLSKQMTEDEIRELIDGYITQEGKKRHLEITVRERIRKEIFHSVRQLGILQELIERAEDDQEE